MLPNLSDLLQYRHAPVLRSYMRMTQCDSSHAEQLFVNMLKYLWLTRKHEYDSKNLETDREPLDFNLVMHEEMREIDNMWHNFILYTSDYMEFCKRYFGTYMHHQPDVAENVVLKEEEFRNDMEKYLCYVYDNLGERTVCDWFAQHLNGTQLAS